MMTVLFFLYHWTAAVYDCSRMNIGDKAVMLRTPGPGHLAGSIAVVSGVKLLLLVTYVAWKDELLVG